jgi:hypothetical protein
MRVQIPPMASGLKPGLCYKGKTAAILQKKEKKGLCER